MGKTPKLGVRDLSDVPLREVSGLAVHCGQLLAVGDRDPVVFVAALDSWPPRWRGIDLAGLHLPDGGLQFEAIESAGADSVLILQEHPARILHLDLAGPSLLGAIGLEVPDGHPLRQSWLGDRSSRGEAMVLNGSGHLVIVKEKNPTAFLEFGPPGDVPTGWRRGTPVTAPPPGDATWTVLATWSPAPDLAAALPDISDATVGPDGALYLVSDQGGAIARLPDHLPPGGGVLGAAAIWRIAGHPAKAEGLVILGDGTPVVALDTRAGRRNLCRLDPLGPGVT